MSNDQANLHDLPLDATEPEPALPVPADANAVAPTVDTVEAKRALEAVLMAASEPMAVNELKRIFDGELSGDAVRDLLEEMREEWAAANRSVELALVASGYRFRVRPGFQKYLDRLSNEKPPRYSRAVLETLAIIAYRQPVTRGDIEDIRGVAVSPHILKTLQDRGWIDEIGHKEVVGRPTLFATTKHFLDDLNLRSLDELPPLHELQSTLDLSQAGAALAANDTPSLPGVATAVEESNGLAPASLASIDEENGATEMPADADEPPAGLDEAPAGLEEAPSGLEEAPSGLDAPSADAGEPAAGEAQP